MSDYLAIEDASFASRPARATEFANVGRSILSLRSGLFRTAGFRLAFMYAIAFGLSSFIVSASLWHSTSGLLDRQTKAAVRVYAKAFARSYASGGLIALTKSVGAAAGSNSARHGLFMLADAKFDRIAGNLDEWPVSVVRPRKWYLLTLGLRAERKSAFFRYYPLPDGFRLLVGHDTEVEMGVLAILQRGMLSALVEMMVLGLIGATMVRLLMKRALADLSAVVDAISEGDLTKRVRQRSSGHEFDRVADAVNEILDRMNALMEGVRNVSNSIAHDLRTPITRVRVRLEDAILYTTEAESLRSAIELATGDLDRVSHIFQALLRIAEVESGTRRSAFHEFDLLPTVLNLVEMYGAVGEERDITLTNNIEHTIRLVGDDQMIQQALANLLGNAMKFSPPGSTVELSAIADKRYLHVVVGDRGPGIPAEDRRRATERFYRAESARNTPGSGLGLALVSAVCTLHGGSLQLGDNDPGLEARIILPRTRSCR